ncbi:DUF1318 domain-containing protein [Verrucomicrobium sp. BvORR106]|uniref:DUF1318 domain-containing protein n=1 Tax=Verrucomicrobium sp. BvORR106 TaxID=1403819 RepID=UPI002240EA7C|nr:DUF1318 domain-containing protein [Verrucomicrobium sp. BvORR106]
MTTAGPRTNLPPLSPQTTEASLRRGLRTLTLALGLGMLAPVMITSCSNFKVDVNSPEPIKVDVSMRLDVYQYKGDEPGKPDAAQVSYEEAVERQRNRMAEIQRLKDNRFVAEDHRGLLHLRQKPAGDWGEYVERTVNAENEDRTLLMRKVAKDSNKPLHEVQAEQWKLRTDKAYQGEWIEVPGDKPNSFKWIQSDGPRVKKSASASGAVPDAVTPASPAPVPTGDAKPTETGGATGAE